MKWLLLSQFAEETGHREVKELAQEHTASYWWSWDSLSCLVGSQALFCDLLCSAFVCGKVVFVL